MNILEEVQQMQAEGKTEQNIIEALFKKGLNQNEISDILAQAQIKEAVTGAESAIPESPNSNNQQEKVYPASYPQYQQEQNYSGYDQYQTGGISADTITEIAEQVFIEKLSPLRQKIEELLNLKTSIETKAEYLDERLKRIEKIIDRLQLSILQKVGSYITNVEDIKKEMEETQKTFKALVEHHHKR